MPVTLALRRINWRLFTNLWRLAIAPDRGADGFVAGQEYERLVVLPRRRRQWAVSRPSTRTICGLLASSKPLRFGAENRGAEFPHTFALVLPADADPDATDASRGGRVVSRRGLSLFLREVRLFFRCYARFVSLLSACLADSAHLAQRFGIKSLLRIGTAPDGAIFRCFFAAAKIRRPRRCIPRLQQARPRAPRAPLQARGSRRRLLR
jgi:hypothetical protein